MTTRSASPSAAAPAPGILFLVSAPSGAGKTSLVAALLERLPDLGLSISWTTRPRRPAERDGVNYHFTDRARFEQMLAAGEFLEHAEVFGNLYGTSARFVQDRLDAGHDTLLEIDWQGAAKIRARLPDACSIFIVPPSLATLEQRLRNRGQDDDAVIANRLRMAQSEIAQYPDYDYVVVNDDFATAAATLEAIVRARRCATATQQARIGPVLAALLEQPVA